MVITTAAHRKASYVGLKTYVNQAVLLVLLMGLQVGCLNPVTTVAPTEQKPPPPPQTPVIIIEVQEVPVTRVVEVTRQVEVTRVITQMITATPEPTLTPSTTPTPGPTFTPAPPPVNSPLLNRLISLRSEIEAMNFDEHIVTCGRGKEDSLTDHYESIIAYPTYNVSGSSSIVQKAYNDYRQAIEIIGSTNKDLYTQCLDFLEKETESEPISSLTAGIARQGINNALGLILPAIELLK